MLLLPENLYLLCVVFNYWSNNLLDTEIIKNIPYTIHDKLIKSLISLYLS